MYNFSIGVIVDSFRLPIKDAVKKAGESVFTAEEINSDYAVHAEIRIPDGQIPLRKAQLQRAAAFR